MRREMFVDKQNRKKIEKNNQINILLMLNFYLVYFFEKSVFFTQKCEKLITTGVNKHQVLLYLFAHANSHN